jgi:hypothetical protein
MILSFPQISPDRQAIVSTHAISIALDELSELEPSNDCREEYITLLEAYEAQIKSLIARTRMTKNFEALVNVGKL